MRKFDKPFDAYHVSKAISLSQIESDPEGTKKYRANFVNNPIYYFHCFQYTGGSIYRAILGYEQLWDKKYEDRLVKFLDFYLHYLTERKEYYLEDIVIEKDCLFQGQLWSKRIKPKLSFSQPKFFKIQGNQRAVARVDLLEHFSPYVDIDLDDGRVFSITYMNYLRLKRDGSIRSLTYANESVTRGNFKTSSQRRKTPKARCPIKPYAA